MKRWILISLRPVIQEAADFGSVLGDIARFTATAVGVVSRSAVSDGTTLSLTGAVAGAVTRTGTAEGDLRVLTGFATQTETGTSVGVLKALDGEADGAITRLATADGTMAAITGGDLEANEDLPLTLPFTLAA